MARARNEDGFGLVELLIAMVVLNVGLLALVGAFTSGAFALNRASRTTAAASVADAQMEIYRALSPSDVGVDTTLSPPDSVYKADEACWDAATATDCTSSLSPKELAAPNGSDTCSDIDTWFPGRNPCYPSRTISATTSPASPDGQSYRVDVYVSLLAAVRGDSTTNPPTLGQRPRKQVTVVVRDANDLSHVYVRETSTIDCVSYDPETPGSVC